MNPTIADDIETILQFVVANILGADKDVADAAQRVEAYLATYQDQEPI